MSYQGRPQLCRYLGLEFSGADEGRGKSWRQKVVTAMEGMPMRKGPEWASLSQQEEGE